MARIIYKLWLDGAIVGEWNDPDNMREGVLAYLESRPEELSLLNLSTFTQNNRTGLTPASSIMGEDILTFIEDIEDAEE